LNLETAVEHGFVGNPGVPGKASFAINGHSLNKNDNEAGCAGIFHKCLQLGGFTQWVRVKFIN